MYVDKYVQVKGIVGAEDGMFVVGWYVGPEEGTYVGFAACRVRGRD